MNYVNLLTFVRGKVEVNDVLFPDTLMLQFISLMESKINRHLRMAKMSERSYTVGTLDAGGLPEQYFPTPADFLGIRDIKVGHMSLAYRTPEMMEEAPSYLTGPPGFFTIIGDSFRILPAPAVDQEIEMIYYKQVPALGPDSGAGEDNNWVTENWPDIYVNGLLFEVHEYMFDTPKADAARGAFEASLEALRTQDLRDRWSGPLETRYVV